VFLRISSPGGEKKLVLHIPGFQQGGRGEKNTSGKRELASLSNEGEREKKRRVKTSILSPREEKEKRDEKGERSQLQLF